MSAKEQAWVDGVAVELPSAPLEPIHHHANGWVHWMTLELNGRPHRVSVVRRGEVYQVVLDGRSYTVKWGPPQFGGDERPVAPEGEVRAPMSCRVVARLAQVGARVVRGQPLLKVEAMKLESTLRAPFDGVLVELSAEPDQTLKEGQAVGRVEPTPATVRGER